MQRFPIPFAPPKHQVDLTQLGRQKLESMDNMTQSKADIMYYLKDHGRSSPQEIARGLNMNFQRVKSMVKELASGEYRWLEWC